MDSRARFGTCQPLKKTPVYLVKTPHPEMHTQSRAQHLLRRSTAIRLERYLLSGGPRAGEILQRSTGKTYPPRPTGAVPRAAGIDNACRSTPLLNPGQVRRRSSSRQTRAPGPQPDRPLALKTCRQMPPRIVNLPRLPHAAEGLDRNSGDHGSSRSPTPQAAAGPVGVVQVAAGSYAWGWFRLPLAVLSTAHSILRGWFTSLDAALLDMPRGIGPAVSALVRLLSLAIAASIISSILSRTTSSLLKLPSRPSSDVGDPYTPGRHSWVAARYRWGPHYCSVCSGAIAWVSDSGVRCQICGSHAHAECSKRAHRGGLACKALCSSDVEEAHRRLFHPQRKAVQEDDGEANNLGQSVEERPLPTVEVMRHQWVRGSIEDSRSCLGCGDSCAGSGASSQRVFSCAWCKQQVHEGCFPRVSEAVCTLGRHRRLILPPIAVLKDQPCRRRKSDIIREAVSKVRRALPGQQNERQLSTSPRSDPKHPSGGPAAPVSGAAPQSFVEVVRDAAAAAVAAAAIDVERGVAGARKTRIAEKVREAVAIGEDGLWEEALGDTREARMEEVNDETALAGLVQGEAEIDELWGAGLASLCSGVESPSDELPFARNGNAALVKVGRLRGTESRWMSWSKGSWRASGRLEREGSGDVIGALDNVMETEITERSTSEGGIGEMSELDGDEREREFYTKETVAAAQSPEKVEQRKQKPMVSRYVGRMDDSSEDSRIENRETISSEYATVEAGVLKPVGADGDGFAIPAEAEVGGDTLKLNHPYVREPSPEANIGEHSPEALATDPAFEAYGEQAVSTWGEERREDDKGMGEDGRGLELGEGEAWEMQEAEGQQGCEEEREWVVKMQELHLSGEGADATKTSTGNINNFFTRKTRSVTLTICEDRIPEDSCPLVVFVNSKSGGRQGGVLINRFRALLNPLQVSDLSSEDPLEVLRRFRNVPNLRLLVCGGDGTVAWLLQAVDAVSWKGEKPPLAILPLGTGNDLARVLGWGSGYAGEDLEALLDKIESAQVTMLDRWSVSVQSSAGKGAFLKSHRCKDRHLMMNNYIGIGVDGQVALDFHKMRESRPVLFFNRAINKVLYAQLGVRSALARAYRDLPARLELRCDGRLVELPETTASIIVLNINSFAGGSKLWAVKVEEENRRMFETEATVIHPLNFTSTQQSTMWAFHMDGVSNPGERSSRAPPVFPNEAEESRRRMMGGSKHSVRDEARWVGTEAATVAEDFSATGGVGDVKASSVGGGQPSREFNPSGGSFDGDRVSESARQGDGVGSFVSSDGGELGDPENGDRRFGRGSWSARRRSRTSFDDGVLEVVAVEGVLHLGQIQLGLSRALPVAQCREVKVRTLGTLPMQVDGEPWIQPPSEITVKVHNQAAMLRPATAAERAVTSVLSDVSQAIHGAEEDLVINERQARALLSRIRRTARVPNGTNDLLP